MELDTARRLLALCWSPGLKLGIMATLGFTTDSCLAALGVAGLLKPKLGPRLFVQLTRSGHLLTRSSAPLFVSFLENLPYKVLLLMMVPQIPRLGQVRTRIDDTFGFSVPNQPGATKEQMASKKSRRALGAQEDFKVRYCDGGLSYKDMQKLNRKRMQAHKKSGIWRVNKDKQFLGAQYQCVNFFS